ncbi:hypothetical protein [Paracoccus salsus]|uniref:hypothetical protein n=1 Tax=Paracoccus salsus TaxID=2911061 RepID=UPI001F1CED58|nr:hypothetical protein [Paracoccus salsus]MCF3972758.1 hypothetical protein [Paracoccus salsus]
MTRLDCDLQRDGSARNLMWARLAEEHRLAPFGLLLQGGNPGWRRDLPGLANLAPDLRSEGTRRRVMGEAPLSGQPIRIGPLPRQRQRYVAERNFLTLQRQNGAWRAVRHRETGGSTPAMLLD